MPARPPKKAAPARATPTTPGPVALALTLSGYEDGAPYTDRPLTSPDRWAMQAADRLTVRLGVVGGGGGGRAGPGQQQQQAAVELALAQHPRALATAKAGVGAVLWPGAVALAAALVGRGGAPPPPGAPPCTPGRVLELGAGAVGLPSLVAAALGGSATATDRPAVLPLLAANAAAVAAATGGRVACAALDWSEAGAAAVAAALAGGDPPGAPSATLAPATPTPSKAATLVLAADCVYEDAGDPAGSPDAASFVAVLAAAMAGAGGCPAWVAVEPRSTAALAAFVGAATARFASVSRLPPPVIVDAGDGWSLDHIHLYELRL
jgi:hypothetical protein